MPKTGEDGYAREDGRAESGRDAEAGTAGGVGTNASKQELYEAAKRLGVEGRSYMTKKELVAAIQEADEAAARQARRG